MNRIFGDGNPNNPEFFFQPFDATPQDTVGPLSPTVQQVEIEYTSKEALEAAYRKFTTGVDSDPSVIPTAVELGTSLLWWYNHQLEHTDAGEQPCIPGSLAIIVAGLSLRKLGYNAKKMGSKDEFRQGIFKISVR